MRLPLFIARRYLFAKKSRNVINIISGISMTGVAVGTMALVVVMSAINGLTDLVESLYSSFDAEIRIESAEGKYFTYDAVDVDQLTTMEEVSNVSRVLEETVLLKYQDAQAFATLKGVDDAYITMSGMDSILWTGTSTLTTHDNRQFMLLGYLIARNLNVNIGDMFKPLQVFAANPKANLNVNLTSAFFNEPIFASGIFSINAELDNKYAVAPLGFVQKLKRDSSQLTAIEIAVQPGTNLDAFKNALQERLGSQVKVKTRYELNELLYKTNNTEKWATFLILSFILLIATFNILGSLTMLILDKKEDLFILSGMGASKELIRNIFFWEGLLITFIGGGIGMISGLLLSFGQQQFKWVKLQGMLVDAYPIAVKFTDLFAISGVVLLIGLVAAGIPSTVIISKKMR